MRFIVILVLFLSVQSVMAGEMKARHSTQCALTKNLSIDQLADGAGIIFKGTLESVSYGKYDGLDVRNLEFKVLDPIKGVNSESIKLREWASIRTPLETSVVKGQPYVFFFHQPSARGLTSLIGMEQGLVEINREEKLKYSPRLSLIPKNKLVTIQSGFRAKVVADADLNSYDGLKEFCLATYH